MLAYVAAAAIVLGSPLIGDLRSALLRAFPRYYVAIVSGGVALGGLLMLAACVRAIRDDRPRRFGALGLALGLAVVSFALLRSGNPNVDAVEAFHFVEYGVLALLFFPFGQPGARWEAYVEAAVSATTVGIADEWFQWFVPGRAGEWHDVLFDLLATACGLLLCLALDVRGPGGAAWPANTAGHAQRLANRLNPGSLSDPPQRRGVHLGLRLALVIAVFGAFLATVHLGSEIRDPEIGVFRSRFTAARLHELGEDRLRTWGGGPPPVVGRYGREDQYEAEALWHVRRRNFGMDSDRKGDPVELDVAWHENLILERHFKPVLDAASVTGAAGGAPSGHRLAPEQVADVDARRAHGSAPFVSDAQAMPIYVWSLPVFWTMVGGLAAAAIVGGAWLDRSRKNVEGGL